MTWLKPGESVRQLIKGTGNLGIALQRHWIATINGGANRVELVGYFPENAAVSGSLRVFVAKASDFAVAVHQQLHARTGGIAAQKLAHPSRAPQRGNICLHYQQHQFRKVANGVADFVHAVGGVYHHVLVVVQKEIEQKHQVAGFNLQRSRDAETGKEAQSARQLGHKSFQQRSIHAMQVAQGIYQAKLWPKVQVQGSVPQRSKVYKSDMGGLLLQSDSRVNGDGGGTTTAFGAHDGDEFPTRATGLSALQGSMQTGKGLKQGSAG